MAQHPDVAIVGGGVIGLTAAYELAKAGFTVEVLDRGPLGAEASWAGAGIIPPGNFERAATPIDRLRALGSVGMPLLASELRDRTGLDTGYRRCGGIEFLHPHDRDVLELWEAEGFPFDQLTGDTLTQLEPAAAGFTGEPYLLPTCAQVRNPWHVRALIAACEQLGVRLRPDTPVEGWHSVGRRVTGVRLSSGATVAAGTCVLAAGAWSETLLKPLGQQPGVHPVRGQIVLFHRPAPRLQRVLMAGKRYFVPRDDGRVLVGSTEEPEAGFEKCPTAAGVNELLRFTTTLIPGWAGAEVEKTWAGLRPGSADGLPYIGSVPGWDGVLVATGHFRAGVQLSVGTARILTELLTGRPPAVPVEAFRLDRPPGCATQQAFRS
ncbi:FAD-dependent oxidoreductase [bacterium]|nr:FAD-dependent oxidoreductase [bacterium]